MQQRLRFPEAREDDEDGWEMMATSLHDGCN